MEQIIPTPELLYGKIKHFSQKEQDEISRCVEKTRPGEGGIGSALIILELGLDADCVIAALLGFRHAVKQGGESSGELGGEPGKEPGIEEIRREYGAAAASLVEGARKANGISVHGKTDAETENIRKMLFAMVNDIRALFIVLAWRLQALRGPAGAEKIKGRAADNPEKKRFAEDCLDIYAPLAGRFGVSWLKDEIEDLSLKYINRTVFLQIKELVAQKKSMRQNFLNAVQKTLKAEAEKIGLNVEVATRAKHFYSIYQKMRRRNKRADEIFDLFGVRVLCGSVEDCYTLLGMVHRVWKPMEGRFKDYIAMPKSNGYQSLHTTVITDIADITGIDKEQQNFIEVQIRTFDMHRMAEYGIASHWLYKKNIRPEKVSESYLPVVEKLKNFLNDSDFASSSLEEMKKEILRDSIFVFTPRGKVVELPSGAVAIDFAYSIHTDIGNHCALAKANGKAISLSQPLQNTQVIEIVTSNAAHPHSSWLGAVKTSRARNKIRSWLAQQEKSEKPAHEKPAPEAAEKSTQKQHTRPEKHTYPLPGASRLKTATGVLVQDEKNMLVRFAKCCNPVSGDDITGFVSRGRGIIVHRSDCNSLNHIKDFEERRINVRWDYGS